MTRAREKLRQLLDLAEAHPRLSVALFGLASACVVWGPVFHYFGRTGYGDWQMVHHNWEVGYVALTRYGEWPLFDPYHCGGITVFGNPESQHFSPFFPLSLIFGTTFTLKIFVILHAWAGFAGMFVLARRHYDQHLAGAAFAAFCWCASGFFAWHISGGHATFLPFYFAPWLLLAWRLAVERPRWCAALAGIMGLTVLEGGTYPFPYFILLLGLDSLAQLRERKRWPGLFYAATLSGTLTLLLGAVRLYPILDTLEWLPRVVASNDKLSAWEVIMTLTWRWHSYRWDHQYVWAEYGAFIGVGGLALGLLGILFSMRRGRLHLVAALLIFLGLMVGNHHPLAPWPLLHELPVFDSLRVPSRFVVFVTFFLALLGGVFLTELTRWLGRRKRPVWLARYAILVPWVLAAGLATDIVAGNNHVVDRFYFPPIDDSDYADQFYMVPGEAYIIEYASFPRRNMGTPRCYEGGIRWPVSRALWLGPSDQVRIPKRSGTVHAWGRTANSMWAYVTITGERPLLFNQNYFPYFTSNVGQVVSERGLLAVELPPGIHHVELRYAPPSLFPTLAISLVGLMLTLGVWFLPVRRRRR